MIFSACCQDKTDISQPASSVSSTAVSSQNKSVSSETASSAQQGTWNMEDLRHKIWLNGKQITVPCTAEQLGPEYTFDENGKAPCLKTDLAIRLIYNNENDFAAMLYNAKSTDDLNKKLIYYFAAFQSDQIDLKIDNITFGATKEEVVKRFGKPTIQNDIFYMYKNRDYQSIQFSFKNNKVNDISCMYLPNEQIKEHK